MPRCVTHFLCVVWTRPAMRGGEHLPESTNSQFSRQLNRKSTLNCSGGGLIDVFNRPIMGMGLFACTSSFVCRANKSLISKGSVLHENKQEAALKRKVSKEAIRRKKGDSKMLYVLEQCGWYYEGLSAGGAEHLLQDTQIGTFLLRRSSSPQYQFSLSVQTEKGPRSVRLENIKGLFQMQSQNHLQDRMPAFRSVVDLIEFYIIEYGQSGRDCDTPVWVTNVGALNSAIVLLKPLRKEPLSLTHLSRLAVQQHILPSPKHRTGVGSHVYKKIQLPGSLVTYLEAYPHTI
ncbi:suppressor of cytokine signaling 2 isoform X2 [Dendroctonus ponderosae]|uniref:suppressor of cytokine signaling 2 isoform X2 n=1 Tax=Dendroctonus ponderosae TaxID=77166 RepID=UPI002034D011|nr:suppressor of cytokine signaling 2 isoform X2 [Dendroctonus ponderosae]